MLPRGAIKKGMKNNQFMFPEFVFETPKVDNGKMILKYFTEDYRKQKQLNYRTIVIDFEKYSN